MGYLTFKEYRLIDGMPSVDFLIPNKEIEYIYRTTILYWFEKNDPSTYTLILENLVSGNIPVLAELFQKYCLTSLSYFDVTEQEPEKFYHAFVLGLLASLTHKYSITSNRESGYGRYDVQIVSCDTTKPAIIIEFKKVSAYEQETLERA